jgi:hypothetical protein
MASSLLLSPLASQAAPGHRRDEAAECHTAPKIRTRKDEPIMTSHRKQARSAWRPFDQARAFAQSLRLPSKAAWDAFCRRGERPTDIPVNPRVVYLDDWRGWSDWLGTGRAPRRRAFLPFVEARRLVHSFGLSDKGAWLAFCRAGKKPANIPADPRVIYPGQFAGWRDWLGPSSQDEGPSQTRSNSLLPASQQKAGPGRQPEESLALQPGPLAMAPSRSALLELLESLRPLLGYLSEQECYMILSQGKAQPSLRLSPTRTAPWQAWQLGSAQEQSPVAVNTDHEVLAAPALPLVIPSDAQNESSGQEDTSGSSNVTAHPVEEMRGQLHLPDRLAQALGDLGEEVASYLVQHRVNWLWDIYATQGRAQAEAALSGQGGRFYREIKARFLCEVAEVERLTLPTGWALVDAQGRPILPNLMQWRTAWLLLSYRRVGNWSEVGTGKTLAALLASRICGARVTLILTNTATLSGWQEQIQRAFPKSQVSSQRLPTLPLDQDRWHYVVFNYERFQLATRHALVEQALALPLDLIVLDEVQWVKQRSAHLSQRREALLALLSGASARNPDLRVLTMSATPVVNSLREAKTLLELREGAPLPDLPTRATVDNALAMHRALLRHSLRARATRTQTVQTQRLPVRRDEHFAQFIPVPGSILRLEQALLPAKIAAVLPYIRPGTLIYSHYVSGMIAPIEEALSQQGWSVGCYTGAEKSGVRQFLTGEVDVLVGSSALATGLDGLQARCQQVLLLSLPWTHALYEQLIGRVYRQGSRFTHIRVLIPQVVLEREGLHWSWDEERLAYLQRKQALAACAVDGVIPAHKRLSRERLFQQSREALEQWIARVRAAQQEQAS